MIKSYLYTLLVISILSSCLNGENTNGKTSEKKELPIGFDFGTIEGGDTYRNEYLDLQIRFDSTWYVKDDIQKQQMLELVEDSMSYEDKILFNAQKVRIANLLLICKQDNRSKSSKPKAILNVIAENVNLFSNYKTGKDYLINVKETMNTMNIGYISDSIFINSQIINRKAFYTLKTHVTKYGITIYQEYFSIIKSGFVISFIITYENEKDKKRLYSFINSIRI